MHENVVTFDTTEEMQEYLRAAQKAAHEGLHPMQSALTWGSHWVRFVDLDQRPPLIEFGRVYTPAELLEGEGLDESAAEEFVSSYAERMVEGDLLFGVAYSLLNTLGEIGSTHKAHAWPVAPRLFEAGIAAECNVTRLTDADQMLLTAAFEQMKAHVL